MSEDTDFSSNEIGGSDVALPTSAELEQAQQERDAKLDVTIRRSAEAAFHGEARPDRGTPPSGYSIDDTLRATMAKIQAREGEAVTPPLPMRDGKPPSIEDTLKAQEQWNKLPEWQQQVGIYAYKEVQSLRDAGAHLGLPVETAADLQAIRQLLGRDQSQQQQSSAPSPVWGKLGVGDEISGDAEGLQRLNDFADRHAETFARNGVSMAQGLEYLMAAQELLERDPQAAINMLAQSYGVTPQAADPTAQVMSGLVEEWASTKRDLTPAIRQEMAELIQNDPRFANGPALNALNAAYSECKRRAAQRAKRHPSKKLEDAVDRAAATVYRR